MSKHVIITGTGRTGTTFLMQLLSHLKLDTGYPYRNVDNICHAGLERNTISRNSPYIVKSPWYCDYLDKVLIQKDISIEYVFVPIRNVRAAAESRGLVTKLVGPSSSQIAGGLFRTNNVKEQEDILLKQFYKLCLDLSIKDIPLILLQYPKITKNPDYLFRKLKPILKAIEYDQFLLSFVQVVKPDWVHSFNKNDI